MQGRFVGAPHLGSKRGCFALQRDTFPYWISHIAYGELALDWGVAQDSRVALLLPDPFQDW